MKPILLITLVLMIVALFAMKWMTSRQIPFNAAAWQEADPRESSLRSRMCDDLRARMVRERWSHVRVREELGEPKSIRANDPAALPLTFEMLVGRPAIVALIADTNSLYIDFDASGTVIETKVVPR